MGNIKEPNVKNTVVLDPFLGDSGKGKIVDYLAKDAVAVVRFNGSNNAGHTLKLDGKTFKTHSVPSGVLHPHTINFIAHGCVINPEKLVKEIKQFKDLNNKIFISGGAHMVLPHHIREDEAKESTSKGIGSTKQGVAPAYASKYARAGLRFQDLLRSRGNFIEVCEKRLEEEQIDEAIITFERYSNFLKDYIISDGVQFIHDLAKKGNIVFEGAQGTFLDVDIGDYPYVTSSSCTIGSVLTGTGLNLKQINEVVAVIKSYGSYVGTSEDFPDIEDLDLNKNLRILGQEYGTTTGRARRLCWLDLDRLKKAMLINGPTKLVITRMDTLGQLSQVFLKHKGKLIEFEPWGDLQDVFNIEGLNNKSKQYLNYIEEALEVPIWGVGVGASREQLLVKD